MSLTMVHAAGVTNADPAAAGWAIHDPVLRLRVHGSERALDLTASDRWVLGSSPECSLHLDDPSGRVSRRHAVVLRDGVSWMLQDLNSTNGLRVNREERRLFQLAPGDEIELGRITLIAESIRSMELHELLRRWLGWSTSCLGGVDRALREVREMANLRAALLLRGAGPLTGVARRLHRITLGHRPFVPLDPNRSGAEGLARALSGMICLDARRLPRDIHAVLANFRVPDMRVRLVACVDSAAILAELVSMSSPVATISLPPLTERSDELERLLEAYASDAVAEFGASWPGLRSSDLELVCAGGIATLDEIEAFARRLVALRTWGVTDGAKRLGIAHGALSRWARRWRIAV